MRKVSEIVKEIVDSSESAQVALKAGYLNLHAYAASIKTQVEEIAWKPVQIGSIVVALSRLRPELIRQSDLKPTVKLHDLHIKSPLCDLTFEKNQHTTRVVQLLYSMVNVQVDYLAVTYGLSEITLICSENLVEIIKERFGDVPLAEVHNLVGVTVSFDAKFLVEPNIIYTILSSLAVKRINIREIISTNTTLTVLIDDSDLHVTLEQLKQFT